VEGDVSLHVGDDDAAHARRAVVSPQGRGVGPTQS
jgi:hypothetical protein